jgi:hypothetical protein
MDHEAAERRPSAAARFHSTCAGPIMMRNTLPPLASNDLFGGAIITSSTLRKVILHKRANLAKHLLDIVRRELIPLSVRSLVSQVGERGYFFLREHIVNTNLCKAGVH